MALRYDEFMAGTLYISGSSTGDPAGSRTIGPFAIGGSTQIGETWAQPLSNGDNTIPVPVGAAAAVLIAPGAYINAVLRLRTSQNPSDGGLYIPSVTLPFVYPLSNLNPTSLIINASGLSSSALYTVVFI